jgi:tetratricopeptide (TPR) repeat protein
VDRSLVEQAGGRYRMLETIRAFCAERLADAGEREDTRAAHAAYFLAMAETAEPYLRRDEQVEWLARLGADHGNLLAALRWATHADRALALRLFAAVSSYWWLRGLRSEATPMALELLTLIGAGPPAGLEEEYAIAVMMAVNGGARPPLPGDPRRIVSAILSGLPDDHPPLRPMTTMLWAMTGGPASADVEHQERLMRQDPWSRALRHLGWGYIRLVQGDATGAETEFAAGVDGFRATGDRWGLAGLLAAQARIAAWRGDQPRSLALADEAYELSRTLGAVEDMADLLCLRAEGLTRSGDAAGARACYERAGEFARRSGAPEMVAQVRYGLGELARLGGDLAEARRMAEQALEACTTESFGVQEIRGRVLVSLGRVAETEGDAAGAVSSYRRASAVSGGDLRRTADIAEGLAGVAVLDGDGERAALLLGAGAALRGMPLADDPDVARVARRATELTGAGPYASAYRRGAAMPREETLAVVEALLT